MKRLFKFKYPKIFLLIVIIFLAYFLFHDSQFNNLVSHLGTLGYLGCFIAGIFFAFGFTAPFSVGFFVVYNPQNIILAGIIGGLGALIADLLIFKFIKISFTKEFDKIKKEKIIIKISNLFEKNLGYRIKTYFLYALAGILIASPLPDEAGVIMLASLTKIKLWALTIISFILNTIGIMVILLF